MASKSTDFINQIFEQLKKKMAPEEPNSADVVLEMLNQSLGPKPDGSVWGWWRHDPRGVKRIQVGTGRSLQFKGRAWIDEELRISNSGNQYWMRFDYADEQGTYPLLVEWRCLPGRDKQRSLTWRLDHNRSAALWRRETRSGQEHLPYPRWQMIDQHVIDALASWPQSEATGLVPTLLTIEGGWADDRWTSDIYRRIEVKPIDRDDDDDAPHYPFAHFTMPLRKWRFTPVQRQIPAERLLTILKDIHLNGAIAFENNLAELLEGHPSLRAIGANEIFMPISLRLLPPDNHVAWLYMNADFATDQLTVTSNASETQISWNVRLQKEAALGAIDRRSGVRLPGLPIEVIATARVLATQSCWLWQETEMELCREFAFRDQDQAKQPPKPLAKSAMLTIRAADLASCDFPLAGRQTPMYPRITYARPHQRNPLLIGEYALHFGDHNGYLQAEAVTKIIGRFDFDPTTTSLIDRNSGRRIRYVSTLSHSTGPMMGARHVFEYAGPEGLYPLVVDWPPVIGQDRYGNRNLLMTLVDHVASLELWRKTTNAQTLHLAPDIWASIDEFSAQALASWPELRLTGPAAGFCYRRGGWLQGKWNDKIYRLFALSTARHAPGARLDDAPNFARSYDMHSWEARNADAPPLPEGAGLNLGLAAKFLDSGALPGEMADEVLHHHPYFRRSDGKAIIFVCDRIEWGRPEPGQKSLAPVVQYCDQDIWLQYRGQEVSYPKLQYITNPRLPKASCFASIDDVLVHEDKWHYEPRPLIWERTASAFMGLFNLTPKLKNITFDGGYAAGEWLPEARFQTRWDMN